MRYPTRKAIDKFNKILNLRENQLMQDWEIECADPQRIDEFLHCYRATAQTDDERFTLMALMLGSFEEYHDSKPPSQDTWISLKEILCSEYELHRDHIDYYSCLGSDDTDEWFPITRLMRSLKP